MSTSFSTPHIFSRLNGQNGTFRKQRRQEKRTSRDRRKTRGPRGNLQGDEGTPKSRRIWTRNSTKPTPPWPSFIPTWASPITRSRFSERSSPSTTIPPRPGTIWVSTFARSERYKEAIKTFEDAISRNPKTATFFNNLGNVYYELGQYPRPCRCSRPRWNSTPPTPNPITGWGSTRTRPVTWMWP